jgi:hypothetical protein
MNYDWIYLLALALLGITWLLWHIPPRRKPSRVLYEYDYDSRYDDPLHGNGCLIAAVIAIVLIVVLVLSSTPSP